jgi:hypothetical protein
MTDRRGFLKAVGAVAAGALVVPAFALITPADAVAAGETWFGSARELIQYDITTDKFVGRIEIATQREQLGLQFTIDATTPEQLRADLAEVRQFAAEELKRKMDQHRILLTDLQRLPIPAGYQEPDWLNLMNPTSAA